ncbi:MAG: PAS domain S-box protein [Acetobacteraceae bacterium]|nr:PAS domain S-box protein [Acetobacteraceae bacterium]
MTNAWIAPERDLLSAALDPGSEAGRERVRLAIENFGLAFFETDLHAGTVTLTPNAFSLFGLPPPPILVVDRTPFWNLYHPDDVGWARERFEADLRGERGRDDYQERVRIVRADDGRTRWIEFSGHMFGPAGARTHIVGMLRDVTAAVEAEERQRLLAREVEHRANNTLAVVQSLVRLTGGENLPGYRRALEGRILALARSHSLTAGGQQGAPVALGTLIAGELAAFEGHVETTLDAVPPLARALVQPVAMILHELATNAAKHGALAGPHGRVGVSAQVEREEVALRWSERGGDSAPAAPPARSGTGMAVVRAQARRLGASLEFHWAATGLGVELRLPLSRWVGES